MNFEITKKKKEIKKKTISNSFTLVELVVVVMVIGILSAIAVPTFQNASDKARQKEPTNLIASYLRAAQAYFTEYGDLPKNTMDLGEYMSVIACTKNYPSYCQSESPVDYTNLESVSWTTPSGYFDIYMETSANKITFRALPVPVYELLGYGTSACFNSQTGVLKISEQSKRLGRNIPYVDC